MNSITNPTPPTITSSPTTTPPNGPTPYISINWRNKGKISIIKDQGRCGSCYAFTTVAAI